MGSSYASFEFVQLIFPLGGYMAGCARGDPYVFVLRGYLVNTVAIPLYGFRVLLRREGRLGRSEAESNSQLFVFL